MNPDSRKAALLLHAMSESDRQWALARLAPPARTTVDTLLEELRELGIPADHSLVHEALADVGISGSQAPDQRDDPVATASVETMVDLLRAESARTIALILSLQEWPWQPGFLARLPDNQREAVLGLCVNDLPPALVVAMRTILCERLEALGSSEEKLQPRLAPEVPVQKFWRWPGKACRS